jgi:hypothetical protein
MSRFSKSRRLVAALVTSVFLGGALAGCSTDIYRDRRETVALGADDAVAANKVVHMIDPWPAASGNNHIPGEGHVVAAAIERYRTGKVIKPIGTSTSSTSYGGAAAAPAAAATGAAANP